MSDPGAMGLLEDSQHGADDQGCTRDAGGRSYIYIILFTKLKTFKNITSFYKLLKNDLQFYRNLTSEHANLLNQFIKNPPPTSHDQLLLAILYLIKRSSSPPKRPQTPFLLPPTPCSDPPVRGSKSLPACPPDLPSLPASATGWERSHAPPLLPAPGPVILTGFPPSATGSMESPPLPPSGPDPEDSLIAEWSKLMVRVPHSYVVDETDSPPATLSSNTS